VARESLLVKVRSHLSIPARRRTQEVVDGEYGSIHRGRSMDFDDLREYVLGDDVKDIDWKATARTGRPLIKRYIASRRHAVLLVVDTGRTMAALADAETTKRDVVVLAAGALGHIAMRHGDAVGLVAGPIAGPIGGWGAARVANSEHIVYVPPRRDDLHLERLLRTIDDGIDVDGEPSRFHALLHFVAKHVHRRSIVVAISDDVGIDARDERMLHRLAAQHEVLHCTVGDVAITEPRLAGAELRAVGTSAIVPAYFRAHSGLHDDLGVLAQRRERATQAVLATAGVASVRLNGEATVVASILDLLERQRLFGAGRQR
jgi:uncharacterized protein (DUF58 family)